MGQYFQLSLVYAVSSNTIASMLYQIQLYFYIFNRGLTAFDGQIGILMQNYCEIDVFLC